MNQEKSKQIASHVVLAQHGNKEAMRTIYIQYYKNIFFICKTLTGNANDAINLTSDIFTKMFSSVEKLSDYMAFESWFYSLAINLCKPYMPEDSENKELISDKMKEIAQSALEAIKSKDKYSFEHSISKLIEEMINTLPNEGKIIFFYSDFALLDAEKIALLEKDDIQQTENSINAVKIFFEKQSEKLKEIGIDVTPFIKDLHSTVTHISAKTFVPDGVHKKVSENIGINVDPFADNSKNEQEKIKTDIKTKKDETEKKKIFSKSDFILFIVVIIVGVLIFSGVKIYREISDDKKETTTMSETVNRPVITWNGAAAGKFESGDGSEENPYIIANGSQLAYLANLVNSGNSMYASYNYKLVCDIVLNDTADYDKWNTSVPENKWTPIGTGEDSVAFNGVFDGNGFSISGMYISEDNTYTGLFGSVKNGSIKNLTVNNAFVNGKDNCGGIVGYFFGDVNMGANIQNCAFSGTINTNGSNTGGIAGSVEATGKDNYISVYNCSSDGKINSKSNNAGGVVGAIVASTGNVKIYDSFSSMSVLSEGENAGGIVGSLKTVDGDATVYTCYNTGSVKSSKDENSGAVTGAIISENGNGVLTVMYCVSLENKAPTLTGASLSDKMSVKSVKTAKDDEMKNADTFEMFDFDKVWTFDQNSEYKYPVIKGL